MAAAQKVIIDTDPGLDDALAILIACASPELEILGLTTCAGNVGIEATTRNALRILRLAECPDIPVFMGAKEPLRRPPILAANIHSADGLGGLPFPAPQRNHDRRSALEAFKDILAAHPEGEVDVLALGPLTNLAQLAETEPRIARRVGRLVAMGGAVFAPGNVTAHAEFNIAADPEAADIAFEAYADVTLVPLDVTRKVAADRDWSRRVAATGGTCAALLPDLIDVYLANVTRSRLARGVPPEAATATVFPMHDPCVMLHAIDQSLFDPKPLPIRVHCSGGDDDGATRIRDEGGRPLSVLLDARVPAALALAAERLARLP